MIDAPIDAVCCEAPAIRRPGMGVAAEPLHLLEASPSRLAATCAWAVAVPRPNSWAVMATAARPSRVIVRRAAPPRMR
jgi:hypothetical protein